MANLGRYSDGCLLAKWNLELLVAIGIDILLPVGAWVYLSKYICTGALPFQSISRKCVGITRLYSNGIGCFGFSGCQLFARQHRDAYAGGDVYLRDPVFGLTFGRFEIGKPPLDIKKMHVLCGPCQEPFHTIHACKVKFLFFVRIDVTYFVAEVIA